MSKIRALKKEAQVALPNSGCMYTSEDGTTSTVLPDSYDPAYEPTEKEILEYAQWLGMRLPEEEELLWIAREGLRAPVPKEWKPCKTDTGEVYHFNFKTGESMWDHPMDEYFKQKFKQEREKLEDRRAGKDVAETKLPEKVQERLIIGDQGAKKIGPAADEGRSSARTTPVRTAVPEAKAERTVTPQRSKKDEPMPKGTPREERSDGPRSLSEHDHNRLADLRRDMKAAYEERLEEVEAGFSRSVASQKQQHQRDVDALQAKAAARSRAAAEEAAEAAQEELESQQREADRASAATLQALESEADGLRARIEAAAGKEEADVAAAVASLGRRQAERVADRVEAHEDAAASDIAALRDRLRAEAAAERARVEADEEAATAAAMDAANDSFAAAAEAKRTAHAEAVRRLRDASAANVDTARQAATQATEGRAAALLDAARGRHADRCAQLDQERRQAVAGARRRREDAHAALAGTHASALAAPPPSEGNAGTATAEKEAQRSRRIADAREKAAAEWAAAEAALLAHRDAALREVPPTVGPPTKASLDEDRVAAVVADQAASFRRDLAAATASRRATCDAAVAAAKAKSASAVVAAVEAHAAAVAEQRTAAAAAHRSTLVAADGAGAAALRGAEERAHAQHAEQAASLVGAVERDVRAEAAGRKAAVRGRPLPPQVVLAPSVGATAPVPCDRRLLDRRLEALRAEHRALMAAV